MDGDIKFDRGSIWSGTQNSPAEKEGSIPFSCGGTLLEKAKQNQNLILAKGAQGRAEIIL
jgi:hypothetical protein